MLVLKWFTVAMLGLAIYHCHLQDRYQVYFLIIGFSFAALIAHVSHRSAMTTLQTYLPFCVILALCSSAIVHMTWRAMSPARCWDPQTERQGNTQEAFIEKTRYATEPSAIEEVVHSR